MLYTCAIFLVQLTHRVFYPRLTPNRLRVPQQCTLCNYWRPSTQFHLHEATKHQALVLHLKKWYFGNRSYRETLFSALLKALTWLVLWSFQQEVLREIAAAAPPHTHSDSLSCKQWKRDNMELNLYGWAAADNVRFRLNTQEVIQLNKLSSITNPAAALSCFYRETEHKAAESETCSIWKESLGCGKGLTPEGRCIKTRTPFTRVSYCDLSLVSEGSSASSAAAVGSLWWTLLRFLSTAKKCIRKSLSCKVSARPSVAFTGMKQINSWVK